MKKNGFTLVELLGVLVVLSVILMIAFPLITTYINKSKQKAYDTQMELIITGLKDYAIDHKEVLPVNDTDYVTFTLGQLKSLGIASNSVVNPLDGKEIDDSMEFRIVKDGSKYTYQIVESTRLSRENNNPTPTITLNGSMLQYLEVNSSYTELGASAVDYNGNALNVTLDNTDLNLTRKGVYHIKYEVSDSNNTKSYAIRTIVVGYYKLYKDGDIVYYNPRTKKKCTDYHKDNSIYGYYAGKSSSDKTDNQTNCMRWYVFLDDGSDTVNLLLDHNTNNYDGRNIKVDEIAKIAGITNWSGEEFTFENYEWLFTDGIWENLNTTSDYWADTSYSWHGRWLVSGWGKFDAGVTSISGGYHYRPVLEIDRSILS